jgi:hypothetical protein
MSKLIEKWHTTGSVLDKARYGKKTALTDEKLEDIWTQLQIGPWKSLETFITRDRRVCKFCI